MNNTVHQSGWLMATCCTELGQRGCKHSPRVASPLEHTACLWHVQENTSADAAPINPKKGAVGSPSALEASRDREMPSMLLKW